MLRIGLTGGIGSGKTAVSNLFKNHGIPVIDTDVIARELTNSPEVLQEIADTFGTDIIELNGELNRKKLAGVVFNDKKNRQQLEKILHPRIETEVKQELQGLLSSHKPPDYVIIVIPLLIEAGYHGLIDRILAVVADEQIRIERVQQRDNRDASEIRAIINSQVDDQQRIREADDIIENNSNIKKIEALVENLHDKYMRLSTATG